MTMDKRQKILLIAVLVLGAGFGFDWFAWGPWSEAMAAADQDRKQARSDLRAAEEKARREPEVAKEWKALKDRLGAVKSEEASNALVGFVDKLIRKHDLKKASLSPEAAAPLQGNAAFREHPLAFSFQCPWEAFVKLMFDFHTAEEFVRIQRLTVQSHYLLENERWLDVTLRLTTVSAAPTGGGK